MHPAVFLIGCLGTRVGIAIAALFAGRYPQWVATCMSIVFAAVGVAFVYLYFTNSRLSAPEAGGSGTWWASFRIVHSAMYIAAAVAMYMSKFHLAGYILMADVAVGAGLWTLKRLM